MQTKCTDCGLGTEPRNLAQINGVLQRLKARRTCVGHLEQDHGVLGCNSMLSGRHVSVFVGGGGGT
jgi:hypothetical protein